MSAPPPLGRDVPGRRAVPPAVRAAGVVLVVVALILLGSAAVGLVARTTARATPMPHPVWMFFVGLPLLLAGAACLGSGSLGAAARRVVGAGTAVPVEPGGPLADERGILGVGTAAPAVARGCSSCGRDNGADARFCDACGIALE